MQERNKKGQFKKKGTLLAIPVIAVAILTILFHGNVMAMIDEMSNNVETKYVAVTAEVKLDCTANPFVEECLKRVTDDVAESFVDLKRAENTLRQAQALYDQTFESHNASIERLNTLIR